jgi:hypothetical protein
METSDFSGPDTFSCLVWGYQRSHSLLLLRLSQGDFISGNETYLLFSSVLYYAGRFSWRCEKFTVAGKEETIKFLTEHGYTSNPEIDIEKYLEITKLYIFFSRHGNVKILGGRVQQHDEIPSGFERWKSGDGAQSSL